jgi:hypothetical protein
MACAAVSTAVPTPLLQWPSLTKEEVIFPKLVSDGHVRFDMRTEKGTVRIESAPRYGCIQIDAADGRRVGPVCNRHMHCDEGAPLPSFPSRLSVYKLPRAGEYYAETGSACYSFCCDLSGMILGRDGRRLDDGPWQRIHMRLRLFGLAALVLGVAGAVFRLRGSRWLGWRIGTTFGFAFAIFMLWWNG